MDGSSQLSAASSHSQLSQAQQQSSHELKMLKKTQDMEKQQSAQLVNSLPQPASPAGVGGSIDVTA